MAAARTVFIFIPHSLINERLHVSYLFGYYQLIKNNILVNCTATVERNNNVNESVYNLINLKSQHNSKQNIRLLGILYSSSEDRHLNSLISKCYSHDFQFILRVNQISGSFHIQTASGEGFTCKLEVRVVVYDGCSIMKSQLLPLTKKLQDPYNPQETFISFLIETNCDFANNSYKYLTQVLSNYVDILDFMHYDEEGLFSVLVSRTLFLALWMISYFYRVIYSLFKWFVMILHLYITLH